MKCFFYDKMDLLGEDSSLSLGWFSIEGIEVVKETQCILLIALCELAEGLSQLKIKRSGAFSWQPCDSGETVTFRSKKTLLEMTYKTHRANLTIDLFLSQVLQLAKDVSSEMYSLRKEVENESAYKDVIVMIDNWPF